MSLLHTLEQRVKDATLNTEIRISVNPDPRGYLIRCPKADTLNVVRELVRILLQNTVGAKSVFLVNLNRQMNGNSVFLQVYHGLSEVFFLLHLHTDLSCLSLTDTFDLRQPLRLFFHNAKRIFPEFGDDFPCKRGPDSFDCSGT